MADDHGVMFLGMDTARILARRARRFAASRRANVAVIFALSLMPLMLAVGGGVDYARAMVVRSSMNAALDAAALAVGASKNLSASEMQTLAQQFFDANYHEGSSYGTPAPIQITKTDQSVTVTASCSMPTSMLKAVGFQTWDITASSTVVWGQLKLWVSLVLDNTGSMSQSDSTGLSKITALKTASHQLLDLLKGASATPGDVQVAVIPFARDVNIGASYAGSTWLSFSDFVNAPPQPNATVGPGDSCPWSDWDEGYHCQSSPTNGSSGTNTIPNWGTYKGYICPSATTTGHYWNGCYTSEKIGNNNYRHTWVPNATSTWHGCITDRGVALKPVGRDYDVDVDPIVGTVPKSFMVAENSPSCPATTVLPLGYDWTALDNKIDSMVANGSTNQTIGLMWGWHAMTQGVPLAIPSLPENTQRIIILLSDGLNTQNRWSGNGSMQSDDVDDRMKLACSNAKAAGIIIYAVFVDISGTQGNSEVLQQCASDSSKFFDLTSSSQIITAFTTIGQQITNLRVSQ